MDEDLNEMISRYKTHISNGESLLEKLAENNYSNVRGIHKMKRKIKKDLEFLSEQISRSLIQNNHINSRISEIVCEVGPKIADRTAQVELSAELQRVFGTLQTRRRLFSLLYCSSSSMGWPTAMHLSLKGLLRIPEAHHDTYQSMISAVPQTSENNLSGLPGKIQIVQTNKDGIPLPYYCKTIKEQVFGSFILLITHSTERILLKDANQLCEDASSDDHVPCSDL
ncbi:hypothetical protein J6590_008570 [Homalodisca vitripennis]|nr:hypothetical protein J6590_008570 [Homalodisca vitripennis]